jgi:NAD(P)H-dependent nitrite reductase small subunit
VTAIEASTPAVLPTDGRRTDPHDHDGHIGDDDDGDSGARWTRICPVSSLELDRGVRALVAGEAVAVFATSFSGVHAIGDLDPFSGASVLSRGLVGATVVDDHPVPFVASPLRKQRFDLRDGRSLEDPDVGAGSWPARLRDGWLEIGPRVS